MVKYLRYLVVILATLFILNINVFAASSKFDPTINLESEIVDDQITLLLGFQGEEVMAINHHLAWETKYLTLVDIFPLEGFTVSKGQPREEGKYSVMEILGDSDYSFLDTNYAVLVFQLTDEFKVGTKTELVWYNYESAGVDIYKYKHKGYIMELNRESRNKMVYLERAITDNTKWEYWLRENWLLLVFGVLVIIAIIVIILVWPTKRRKEHREKKVREQAKDKNYNYGKNNYKVDHEKLDKISGINQEKDMSEAIVISDLNPFQAAQGTARTVAGEENIISTPQQGMGTVNLPPQAPVVQQPVQAGVQLVDNLPVNNNPENLAQVYIPDQVLAPGQQQVVAPPQASFVNMPTEVLEEVVVETPAPKNEFDVGIDPFNMKLETPTQNVEMPVQSVEQVQQVPTQTNEADFFQEIPDGNSNTNDNLVLFQPQTFDSATNQVQNNNNNNIETLVLAFIFILGSIFFSIPTNALNYEVDNLRECLVGNIPHDTKYDYNSDGRVDVVDLIATKDLNYATMEQVGDEHPQYIRIETQGYTTTRRANYEPILTSRKVTTHPGFKTTSTSTSDVNIQIGGDNTTTQYYTTTSRTTNKSTTKNSTSNKLTTSKKTTTAKGTTTKKTTTKATTTTKTTTTKKTYTVRFKNGATLATTVTVEEGKNATAVIAPKEGYSFSTVTCTEGQSVTYNTSTNKVTVANVSADSTCTIKFALNSYKISLDIYEGTEKTTKTKTIDHGSKFSQSQSSTYYDVESYTCNRHTPTYDGSKFVINKVTSADFCELVLIPKKYKLTLTGLITGSIETNYTKEAVTQTFYSTNDNLKYIKCGTSKIKLTKTEGDPLNTYTFKYQVKANTTCELS